jgi:hypothetical protein
MTGKPDPDRDVDRLVKILAKVIGDSLPDDLRFALVTFPAAGEGPAHCISTADRGPLAQALRDCAELIEAGCPAKPVDPPARH